MMLEPVLDALPPIRRCAGRPRKRPAKLHADRGCDYRRCRRACRRRGITPRIARRGGVDGAERLGRHRRVWNARWRGSPDFRRLAVRHERRADIRAPSTASPPALSASGSRNDGSVRRS
jgi:IS5 family transposase